MTRFTDQFKKTAAPNLVRQFGESVTYRPLGGTARTIEAIVERDPVEIMAAAGDVPASSLVLSVQNSATTGISSSQIDTGGDQVDVALRYGESTRTLQIVQVVGDEHGSMVSVLVQ